MGRRLWCRKCGQGVTTVGGELPTQCDACKVPGQWTALEPQNSKPPRRPYALSVDDRAFLKTLRIASD